MEINFLFMTGDFEFYNSFYFRWTRCRWIYFPENCWILLSETTGRHYPIIPILQGADNRSFLYYWREWNEEVSVKDIEMGIPKARNHLLCIPWFISLHWLLRDFIETEIKIIQSGTQCQNVNNVTRLQWSKYSRSHIIMINVLLER